MSRMTDIRFRLQIVGGNMRMIKRDVFEYFKKEPDVMQVKDVVRLLHCSKNTVYKLIHEGRIDSIKIGRNILIPKTALVEMMVNERYYQIIYPYNPDSLWTMKERKYYEKNHRAARRGQGQILCGNQSADRRRQAQNEVAHAES